MEAKTEKKMAGEMTGKMATKETETATAKKSSKKSSPKTKKLSGSLQCALKDMKGGSAGTVDLNPEVFGAPAYAHLVHQVVRWQLAKRRAGTHDVLTRSEMKGGKKKPMKQKGSGRARAGSSVSPLWVGGAVVHGPTPRSYEFKIPKEVKRKALCAALSQKVKAEQVVILDKLEVKSGKTSEVTKALKDIGINKNSALIVMPELTTETALKAVRATSNIGNIKMIPVAGVNVYDLLKYKYLVINQEALKGIEERCLRS